MATTKKIPHRYTIESEGDCFRVWWRPMYIAHQKCGLFASIEKARESLWTVPPALTRYFPEAIEEYGSVEMETAIKREPRLFR